MGELIAILRRALSLVVCQSYLFASGVCRLLQQTNAEEWICFQHMQTAIADECWCNKLGQFWFGIEHPMIILMTSLPRLPPMGGGGLKCNCHQIESLAVH